MFIEVLNLERLRSEYGLFCKNDQKMPLFCTKSVQKPLKKLIFANFRKNSPMWTIL